MQGGKIISNETKIIQSEERKVNTKKTLLVLLAMIAFGAALYLFSASPAFAENGILPEQTSQFGKHLDIWFMTFLIAILMMFIKKFEWGVAVAVLLSAASTYVTYLAVMSYIEPGFAWSQETLIRGAVASITAVIVVGCFVGTIKSWQYILVGVLFAPVYYVVEWLCGYYGGIMMDNGNGVMDPGGAILVHMCAAYFGLGAIMAIREKRAFDEPMYSTTHSFTFAWLASMLLFMLWPSFVTAFLEPQDASMATAVCYMAGMGSIISAYVTGMVLQKKINPGIYAFALLAGPVAMSPIMLIIDPFFAFVWGILAGILVTLCFIYLQPWLCEKLGVLDVMGVHNLHGMAGWMGVAALFVMTWEVAVLQYAFLMVAVTLVCGFAVGLLLRFTRGRMDLILDDRAEFIFNEDPDDPEHLPIPQIEGRDVPEHVPAVED